MKVLKKNDEFRRMPERGVADQQAIKSLISMGWNYSPKKAMKDLYKAEDKVKIKSDEKTEAPAKVKTTAKERRSDEKKKSSKK